MTYTSTDFETLSHILCDLFSLRRADFNCHRRRIESNFTRETFRQCIGQILLHSRYEGTDFEELALDIGFHPVEQTDAGKLAREVGLSTTGDSSLVPNQKKRRDDALDL